MLDCIHSALGSPLLTSNYIAVEAESQFSNATLADINYLVDQLKLRDDRMNSLESDLKRMTEDCRRLREDMLPALRLAKDAQQPLPKVSSSGQNYAHESGVSPPGPTPPGGPGVKRQYSQRKILIGAAPPSKSTSPTQAVHERTIAEHTLDPSSAAERAVLSSTHLAALNSAISASAAGTPNGLYGPHSTFPSPNIPSPASPQMSQASSATLFSRHNRNEPRTGIRPDSTASLTSDRSTIVDSDYNPGQSLLTLTSLRSLGTEGYPPDSPNPSRNGVQMSPAMLQTAYPQNGMLTTTTTNSAIHSGTIINLTNGTMVGPINGTTPTPQSASSMQLVHPGQSSMALATVDSGTMVLPVKPTAVEIFKSFRVGMDDKCSRVLPAALRKYQIGGPWWDYALVIVHGDGERCLALEEKPLSVYKGLDRHGHKPMFMLRKLAPGGVGDVSRSIGYDVPGGLL